MMSVCPGLQFGITNEPWCNSLKQAVNLCRFFLFKEYGMHIHCFLLNKKLKRELVGRSLRSAFHGRNFLLITIFVIDTLPIIQCVQLYVNLL